MPNLLDKLYWCKANQANSLPSPPEQPVDLESGYAVLEFTYRYLEADRDRPAMTRSTM